MCPPLQLQPQAQPHHDRFAFGFDSPVQNQQEKDRIESETQVSVCMSATL